MALENFDAFDGSENRSASCPDQDTLSEYLASISHFPVLSAEEELSLYLKMHDGDGSARAELINCNLKLVVYLAKKYGSKSLCLLDVIEEGNVGLINAVDRFDPSKGRLSTYASYWIKDAILDFLFKKSRSVSISDSTASTILKISKARNALTLQDGCEPDTEKLACYLEMDTKEIAELDQLTKIPVSWDQSYGEEDSSTLADTFPDNSNPSPESHAEKLLLHQHLSVLLDTLTPRERDIVELLFGLKDDQPWTLSAISEKYNVTRDYIKRIEKAILQKLRVPADEKCLYEFIE